MKSFRVLLCGTFLAPLAAGCDAVRSIIGPSTTSVSMVNNSEDYAVDATLFISDEQDVPEDVLTELGTELTFSIGPGESTSFTRDCDELQAIIVENAELRVLGGLGPETGTDVLRDGTDFGCGDRIVFTFDHSELILDFDVTASVP
ncbi:MAG: hypothetical protein V2A79_17715 [Planctomycetota bacterium]